MHKMAFAHVFGPGKKNGFGPFSYKFFVCIRVGLMGIFAFQFAKVEVWFQLECAPEKLVSVVTANRNFYVATFFLWYPNLITVFAT